MIHHVGAKLISIQSFTILGHPNNLKLFTCDIYRSTEFVATVNLGDDRFRNMTPYQFDGLLDMSRIPADKRYYWWRGISAAYLTRPNERTQKLVRSHGTPGECDMLQKFIIVVP